MLDEIQAEFAVFRESSAELEDELEKELGTVEARARKSEEELRQAKTANKEATAQLVREVRGGTERLVGGEIRASESERLGMRVGLVDSDCFVRLGGIRCSFCCSKRLCLTRAVCVRVKLSPIPWYTTTAAVKYTAKGSRILPACLRPTAEGTGMPRREARTVENTRTRIVVDVFIHKNNIAVRQERPGSVGCAHGHTISSLTHQAGDMKSTVKTRRFRVTSTKGGVL